MSLLTNPGTDVLKLERRLQDSVRITNGEWYLAELHVEIAEKELNKLTPSQEGFPTAELKLKEEKEALVIKTTLFQKAQEEFARYNADPVLQKKWDEQHFYHEGPN